MTEFLIALFSGWVLSFLRSRQHYRFMLESLSVNKRDVCEFIRVPCERPSKNEAELSPFEKAGQTITNLKQRDGVGIVRYLIYF